MHTVVMKYACSPLPSFAVTHHTDAKCTINKIGRIRIMSCWKLAEPENNPFAPFKIASFIRAALGSRPLKYDASVVNWMLPLKLKAVLSNIVGLNSRAL